MIMAHLLLFLTLKWWGKYQLPSQLSEKPRTEVLVGLQFHAQSFLPWLPKNIQLNLMFCCSGYNDRGFDVDYFLAAENILNSDGKNAFLPRLGTKQVCLLLPLLFNTILGVLTSARMPEKEIKGIQMERKK